MQWTLDCSKINKSSAITTLSCPWICFWNRVRRKLPYCRVKTIYSGSDNWQSEKWKASLRKEELLKSADSSKPWVFVYGWILMSSPFHLIFLIHKTASYVSVLVSHTQFATLAIKLIKKLWRSGSLPDRLCHPSTAAASLSLSYHCSLTRLCDHFSSHNSLFIYVPRWTISLLRIWPQKA